MPDLELVVSRHAEDLRWLRRVPKAFRVTVYDKGGDREDAIPLPNVGYEAHTYLHHVVTRYADLAPTTVFVQGHPFDHAPDLHRRLRALAAGRDGETGEEGFRWLGFVIDHDDPKGERLFRTWSKNRDGRLLDLDGFHRALFGTPGPERFVFYPGAQFVVRADLVRTRPRAFYERALALSTTFPDAGHAFERTWDRVFGVDGLPPRHRGRDLPLYLRPIRRLGTTWDSVADLRED